MFKSLFFPIGDPYFHQYVERRIVWLIPSLTRPEGRNAQ